MKKVLAAVFAASAIAAMGAPSPLWLRNTNISPDGNTVAFTFKGDIYTVPFAGGAATRLTTSEEYDSDPYFSPDGSKIAFTSNRRGSADVYVVDAVGGTPVRLTTHSGNERVRGWLNDSTVIFTADIMPSQVDLNGPFFTQLYTVGLRPGRAPRLLLSLAATALSVSPDGRIIFENKKSYENIWRKHEHSAGTPDIYMYSDGMFTPLQTGSTAMRTPVWTGDSSYVFTAEDEGSLNVYSARVGAPGRTRLTSLTTHPVRSLTATPDGSRMAFSYDGEIYTLVPGSEPQRLDVSITTDDYDADHVRRYVSSGADGMAVSNDGKEVAFTLRGDIYVTSTKYETTRRITNTPGQERSMDFAPGGRALVYDAERDSIWKLYIARIPEGDRGFAYATRIDEELLYSSDKPAQQPEFSPDGKKVAFLEDRTTLRVIDLDSRQVTTALDGRFNYSYADGDITFCWSPDSKWLLIDYIGVGGWNNTDIALVAADGSEVVDLTESGYSDSQPAWALGGKAITYATGKYGYRSHGSWGNEDDIVLMALDGDAWDRFNRSAEEAALAEEDEEDDDEAEEEPAPKKKKKGTAEPEAPAFDLANRRYRTARLTENSAHMGDYYLSADGDALYYLAAAPEGGYKLYKRDIREDETEVLAEGLRGGFVADSLGENLFFLTASGISKVSLDDGSATAVEFDAPYDRHPSLEREYIYNHAAREIKDKFYDPTLHGVDWDGYVEAYRRFLPYINNRADFAVLLSELLGELNASHTGASAYSYGAPMETATLGAWFDPDYEGEGLKVVEVLPRGPLGTRSAAIAAGDVILAIDGDTIGAGADYFPLLDDKAGRRTRLTVRRAAGNVEDITVKPSDDISTDLYRRWVEHNQALVDSLSDGRLAYIHIEGMDSPSFRTAYDELLGRYRNREAAIVDTRFNGGGWLHNDVAILLGGKAYATFAPRGQYVGTEPYSQWTKPSVMLVNEANYSDAYGTPYTYQTLGIGELIGAPVPGTMTAVWWEDQIDPMLVFGIPQVTTLGLDGHPLENRQLIPEVTVYNTPAETVAGNDEQIRAAVARLLERLDAEAAPAAGTSPAPAAEGAPR